MYVDEGKQMLVMLRPQQPLILLCTSGPQAFVGMSALPEESRCEALEGTGGILMAPSVSI